ncbi:MAG: hypothetical protein EOP84_35105, partial [Verrucomicrobiaceae bacterium]
MPKVAKSATERKARNVLFHFHGKDGPVKAFNAQVLRWLRNECPEGYTKHDKKAPEYFPELITVHEKRIAELRETLPANASDATVLRESLNFLSQSMAESKLKDAIGEKHSSENYNQVGSRTPLSQSLSKNLGENFVNLIVFTLATLLEGQDEVLVEKNLPAHVKHYLGLGR